MERQTVVTSLSASSCLPALSALTIAPVTRWEGALTQGRKLKTKSLTQFTSFDRLTFRAQMRDALVYACKWQVCPSSLKAAAFKKKNTHSRLEGYSQPRRVYGPLSAQWESLERKNKGKGGTRKQEKGQNWKNTPNLEGRKRERGQQRKPRANGERSRWTTEVISRRRRNWGKWGRFWQHLLVGIPSLSCHCWTLFSCIC